MSDDLIARIIRGATAGLVGTFALQGLREPSQKLLPHAIWNCDCGDLQMAARAGISSRPYASSSIVKSCNA